MKLLINTLDVNMAYTCNINTIEEKFKKSLSSVGKVQETLLTLLKDGATIEDIVQVVTAPMSSRIIRTLNPEIRSFISDKQKVLEFLGSPKTINTPEAINTQNKEIEIDNPDEIIQNSKKSKTWVHDAWGVAALAQIKFMEKTNREINDKIFSLVYRTKKTENPELILNSAIQNYFIYNLNQLKDFFIRNGKEDYAKLIEDNMPFGSNILNPHQRINTIISNISDFFSKISDQEKIAYTQSTSPSNDIAQAYARFLLIHPLNFDNFLKDNYNSITIKNFGKLSSDVNKYSLQLGKGRQNATWQDEDSIYKISRMVDSVVQNEIATWPLYRKVNGIWTKQEDEYCDTNKVVGITSKLLNVANLSGSKDFTPYIYNATNSKLIDDLKNTFREAFGINLQTGQLVIDEIFTKYIEDRTLPEIVSMMSLDMNHLFPVIMYLLTKETGSSNKSISETSFKNGVVKFETNEVEFIHSIWHNMFDPLNNDSLFNNPSDNSFDVYQMIMQVFGTHERKTLYGIVNDMGEVDKKYYSIGKANQRLNYFQAKINGFYSPIINRTINNVTIESDFKEEEPFTKIQYKVPGKPVNYSFKIVKGSVDKILRNGKEISNKDSKLILGELKGFFEDTLKLDFTSNNRGSLIDIYINKIGNSSLKALQNLVDLSVNMIYANEISKSLQGESTSDFKNALNRFYNKIPKLVKGVTYNQIDIFSGRLFPLLSQLSIANDIHDGIIGDIVVKGGAGEMINSVILHTLLTNYKQFAEEKSQDPESAIKHFSLKNVFKQMTFLRDYVDKTGDVKSSTSMNVDEFLINNFLYDFYSDSMAVQFGVLSDKPNIVKMELYSDREILVGDKSKKLKDCSANDLKKVAVRELGIYYQKMKNEMDRNLTILSTYSPKGIKYDINTDYAETRAYTKKDLEQDIHASIYAAQKAGEDIEINELLYFSWEGNILHTKPSLIAELIKHDIPVANTFGLPVENSEQFFTRKESELVVNLLQDLSQGISFIDTQSQKVIDSPSIKNMLKIYKDKESLKDWKTNRNIIIGKVSYGDKVLNLITKKSISEWSVYKNLQKYIENTDKYEKEKLDINGDFDFQYFLKVLNKLYPKIQEESFTKKAVAEFKKKLQDKLNKSNSKINRKALIEGYRQWRLQEHPEETQAELNQAILNYETESDERIWRVRDTASKLEGLEENVTSLKDLEDWAKKYKININTDFEAPKGIKFTLKVNPEIQRYNALHYLYSEEGLNSTVGSHINHKAKYMTDLTKLGAIETGQQAKRNVSESGSKNQYTRGDIQGMNPNMTIAVVKDVKASISTINGVEDAKAATVMDGSTIGNYVTRKEELYSLGSQKAGIENSKPLGNDLNSKTGTGTIIKTAVFVLTNGRIRSSQKNIILHKHMNSIPWNPNFDGNFLVDYNGEQIKYHPVIVFKPSTGGFYLRNNFQINNDGTTSFDEIEINNTVLKVNLGNGVTLGRLIKDGNDISPYLNTIKGLINPKAIGTGVNTITTTRPIRTNYELWDLFGGAYSAAINDNNELTYANDNTSLENLTIACHSVGAKLVGNATRLTNQDVWLPLKEAKIDWVVTEGAIKQGASNMNSTEMLENINYPVTTQKISTIDVGMQLNPEHLVDKSHVTLMTQVVNALGLRGFSADVANRCYQALASLTDYSLQDLFKGIEIDLKGGGNEEFKDAVSSLLLKSIIGTSETDGDLLAAIVIQLNKQEKNGHDYDIIKHKLPISDPAILNKLISNFSSLMTKAGIRIQFPGSMNVLVPSDGIYRIHGGKLRTFASTQRYDENLIDNNEAEIEKQRLQELQNQQQPLEGLHAITIGGSYYIRITNKQFNSDNPLLVDVLAGKSIKIDDLSTYYKVRDLLKGTEYTITEDVIAGRELAPYNCVFETDKGKFMLWDLDSIKHIHMIKQDKNNIKLNNIYTTYSDEQIQAEFHINPALLDKTDLKSFVNSFTKLINRRRQIELNSIGSGNDNDAYINGEKVIIDKSTLQKSPYEFIAPKNYETTFGLRIGDDLQDIANDNLFFLKRILNTYYKVENGEWIDQTPIPSSNYDLILKTVSGKHYPLLFKSENSRIPEGLQKISDEEFYNRISWEGNKVYWLDGEGYKLYELPYELDSNKRVVYKADILVDNLGNEVIYTGDIKSFVNKISFNNIDFGKHLLDIPNIQDVMNQLEGSKKRSIQKLYKQYNDLLTPINSNLDPQQQALLNIQNENILKQQLTEYFYSKNAILTQLNSEITTGQITGEYFGIYSQLINSAIETHTSFLKSLDYIVSRTPAQSHQSFMPMKLVAFDESGKNSAYVNRYQLYLQGSDYDVDKASLLGSIFRNGKYVKWSPFMNLSSYEHLRASETLPFPTGKRLQKISKNDLNKRFYDVIDKPINLEWNDNYIVFSLPNSQVQITLNKISDNQWQLDLTNEYLASLSNMEQYILERAIVDKLNEGDELITEVDLSGVGIQNGVKNSKSIDYVQDFLQFNDIFRNIDINTPEGIQQLGILLNAYNQFGMTISDATYLGADQEMVQNITKMINEHNTFFEGSFASDPKDAVVNFISSTMFQISSDPVNLIQAMTSVDQQTEVIKDKASTSKLAKQSQHFDKGNIMSTFRLLRLTLSGKQDTGIEASSLKVMEAINQYQDQILNYGNDEEQRSLIKPINIGGYDIQMICNAYCKNIANIKSKEVYDALQQINNDEDQALWLSAFLSLSTDNAKDPTLSKINANPEMIGLYNAGFVLGLPIEFLSKVMMSTSGMALAQVQQGNVFLGINGSRNLTRVLNYIDNGPRLQMNQITLNILTKAIELQYGEKMIKISPYNLVKNLLPNIYRPSDLFIAKRIIKVAKSLAYSDGESGIESNLPTLKERVSKELQIKSRQLSNIKKSIEAIEQTINEAEIQGKRHKKLDNDLQKLTTRLEELETQVLELKDIKTEIQISQSIPNKGDENSKYEEYRKYQKQLESLSNEGQVGLIRGIESYKEAIKDSRNFKKTIADLEAYIDIIEQIQMDEGFDGIDGEHYYSLGIIRQLNQFAHEMSLIRPNLGLNQQLPNSKENQINFIKKFENAIYDRLDNINPNEQAKETSELEALADLNTDKNKYSVDLIKFIWDENYRNTAIAAYESIKYKVNILDVLLKVPHYFGYLKSCGALYKSLQNVSVQYREQDRIAEKIIRGDLKISNSKDIQKRLKTASRYISRQMNNMFLVQQNIELTIPKIKDKVVDENTKVTIKLGTIEGNVAFKEWMDMVVIPKYKKLYISNRFFKELGEATYHKTDNHNTNINYTTGIDSMSNNPSDKTKVAEVIESFNRLATKEINGLPMVDAFFYYDLIAYDRQPGQQALTPIFNTLAALGNTQVIKDYIAFVSDLDQSGQYILSLDNQQIEEIERFIAPTVSIYALDDFREKYAWVKDPADQKFYLIQKIEQGGEYDDEMMDYNEDIDISEDLGFTDTAVVGEDFDINEPLTLQSKLKDLGNTYEIISNVGTLNNPYLQDFTILDSQSILEGTALISPNELRIGNSVITLDNDGKAILDDAARKKLQDITGQKKVDDLVVSKTVIQGTIPVKVIDIETTKANLENPCK